MRLAGGGDGHATQRVRTLGGIMRSMITFFVGAGACVHGLEILGWNVSPLLAGAGVVGVAVGFGAQALIGDIISGLFILAEDQFAIGDMIEVNGIPATVDVMIAADEDSGRALEVCASVVHDFNAEPQWRARAAATAAPCPACGGHRIGAAMRGARAAG